MSLAIQTFSILDTFTPVCVGLQGSVKREEDRKCQIEGG